MSIQSPCSLKTTILLLLTGGDFMTEEKKFLEIETKYDATDIDRIKFKVLAKGLSPTRFIYGEGTDIYFIKADDDFLRYRMPMVNSDDKRSELTFKKKSTKNNNMIRTEVNLRID